MDAALDHGTFWHFSGVCSVGLLVDEVKSRRRHVITNAAPQPIAIASRKRRRSETSAAVHPYWATAECCCIFSVERQNAERIL